MCSSDLGQEFKIAKYGVGRVDVNKDGLDDLQITLKDLSSTDKITVLFKSL